MKTISIKKRLAAVTVLALAAGVMSSVAANATTGVYPVLSYNSYPDITYLAPDGTGAASLAASAGTISSAFTPQSSTAAAAGVMLASGRLAITVVAPASTATGTTTVPAVVRDTLVVTGGQIINSAGGSGTLVSGTYGAGTITSVSTDGTKIDLATNAVSATDVPGDTISLLIAPTVAAGGSITIQRFAAVSSQFGGSSVQSFIGNISVAATGATGAVSTSKSWAYLNAPSASPAVGAAITYDDATGFTVQNGYLGNIQFAIHDAYKNAVYSGATGALQVSSDNCVVAIGSNYSTKKSIYVADAGDAAGQFRYISVAPAVANTATTCATTISFDGTVIATKTIKFLGDIATMTVAAGGVQAASDTSSTYTNATTYSPNGGAGLLSVTYKDAAGNVVPGPVAAVDSGSNAYVTTLAIGGWIHDNTDVARAIAGKSAAGSWICGGSAGSASLVLKVTNAAYATIKSAPVTLACGNAADSYTIATDKATYATGAIATVSITFKDANGAVPNDVTAYAGNTVASGAWATNGYVVLPAGTDTSTSGVLTYKMVVGQTAGSFPVVVDVPAVDAAHGKAQTAQITVTSQATDAVSQLVKVVGTLLTSFTKQIAALIKALAPAKKK